MFFVTTGSNEVPPSSECPAPRLTHPLSRLNQATFRVAMRPLPALIVCLASLFTSVCSLSCLPCREVTCELPAAVTHCSWGFVLDMCGCCYVCGKGPGETCGGQWAWHGRCGRDLDCRRPHELSSVARRRQEEVGGGNVLALLNMDEPSRCHRRTDSVADRLTTFFTWISSLFRTTARDD